MAESETHSHLKLIGMEWLKFKVTDLVGMEIEFESDSDLVAMEVDYHNIKSIADVAGINLKRKEIRIIECKATKQDFMRDKKLFNIEQSYYKHCHYFYIMCPEEIISLDDIPKEYGLLWVNSKDEVIVKRNPVKYKGRLKTMFDTSLKNVSRAVTNYCVFKEKNRENRDVTAGKFARKASIAYASIKCPYCKKVMKDLINISKPNIIICEHCKSEINTVEAKINIITSFNKKFIDKINKLNN